MSNIKHVCCYVDYFVVTLQMYQGHWRQLTWKIQVEPQVTTPKAFPSFSSMWPSLTATTMALSIHGRRLRVRGVHVHLLFFWFPIRMSHEYTTIESGLGIIKTRLIFRCGPVQVLRRMQDHVVWKLLDELAEAGRWFNLMIPIMSYITILTLRCVHTYL